MHWQWYLDGVLIFTVLLMGLYFLLPMSRKRRKQWVFWTFFIYLMYVSVLMLGVTAYVIWELLHAPS